METQEVTTKITQKTQKPQDSVIRENKKPALDPVFRKKMEAKLNFMEKRVEIAKDEAVKRVSKDLGEDYRELAKKNVTLYSKEIAEIKNLLK